MKITAKELEAQYNVEIKKDADGQWISGALSARTLAELSEKLVSKPTEETAAEIGHVADLTAEATDKECEQLRHGIGHRQRGRF